MRLVSFPALDPPTRRLEATLYSHRGGPSLPGRTETDGLLLFSVLERVARDGAVFDHKL